MQNKIFLLSHQDDEIAIFNHIRKSVLSKDNISIFFLTNGRIKKIDDQKIIKIREKESLDVLNKIGVKKNNIFFLGKKLKTNSYNLHNKLDITINELSKFFEKIKNDAIIYSHSWEGGNVDHDSCYVITIKLMKKFACIKSAFQFSMYNSQNMPFNFYRAFSPIKENGHIISFNTNLRDRIRFILLSFHYKSQKKIWFGLYPFLILRIIFNRYGNLQIIKNRFLLKKPHQNNLWYERRNFISYNRIKLRFLSFLR